MTDEFFMREALKEANKAYEKGEVPVGALVVYRNKIISRAHNMTETLNDVTAHAEMLAFTSAANYIGGKFLKGCTLYVTLEPCVMCSGASYWTQIDKIVYGTNDEKRGVTLLSDNILHPKTIMTGGVLQLECASILSDFFRDKRN